MGRLPLVCHILKPQQLRDNLRLSARPGVSPAETTRCSASARNARDVQRATPRDPKSIPPGPDLGALKPSPIQNDRRRQPRCAAGPLSGARAGLSADSCSRPAARAAANSPPTDELNPLHHKIRLDWEVDQADRRKTVGRRGRSGSSSGSRSHQATPSRSRSSSSTGRLVASARLVGPEDARAGPRRRFPAMRCLPGPGGGAEERTVARQRRSEWRNESCGLPPPARVRFGRGLSAPVAVGS